MRLPKDDIKYLNQIATEHQIAAESNMCCIVIPNWPLPRGFDQDATDLLIRLKAGYPDVPPDMWWFSPAVHLANGEALLRTSVVQPYLGRSWQRWSRHIPNEQWISGIDGLQSFLALIRQHMEHSVPEMVR